MIFHGFLHCPHFLLAVSPSSCPGFLRLWVCPPFPVAEGPSLRGSACCQDCGGWRTNSSVSPQRLTTRPAVLTGDPLPLSRSHQAPQKQSPGNRCPQDQTKLSRTAPVTQVLATMGVEWCGWDRLACMHPHPALLTPILGTSCQY